MERLKTFTTSSWQQQFSSAYQVELTRSLEQGQVLFFPKLAFQLSELEQSLLSPVYVNPKSKNISYNQRTNLIGGLSPHVTAEKRALLHALLTRFSIQSKNFVSQLFPRYLS